MLSNQEKIVDGIKDCINSELQIISYVKGKPSLGWIVESSKRSINNLKEILKKHEGTRV